MGAIQSKSCNMGYYSRSQAKLELNIMNPFRTLHTQVVNMFGIAKLHFFRTALLPSCFYQFGALHNERFWWIHKITDNT